MRVVAFSSVVKFFSVLCRTVLKDKVHWMLYIILCGVIRQSSKACQVWKFLHLFESFLCSLFLVIFKQNEEVWIIVWKFLPCSLVAQCRNRWNIQLKCKNNAVLWINWWRNSQWLLFLVSTRLSSTSKSHPVPTLWLSKWESVWVALVAGYKFLNKALLESTSLRVSISSY